MPRPLVVIIGTVLTVTLMLGGVMVGGVMLIADDGSQSTTETPPQGTQTSQQTNAKTEQPRTQPPTPVTTPPTPTPAPAQKPETLTDSDTDTGTPIPESSDGLFEIVPEEENENQSRQWEYDDFEWYADNPDYDDDADYVKDSYERNTEGLVVGEKDSDGDGVPDGAELAGFPKRSVAAEGPPGNTFDADPQERDLVVDIVYADSATDKLWDSEVEDLEEEWESFPSEYPIDAHIEVNNEGINLSGEYPQDFDMDTIRSAYDEKYKLSSVHKVVVISDFSTDEIGGTADPGGQVSVVHDGADNRQAFIVHELMHNIIGPRRDAKGCSTSLGHSCGGYLSEDTQNLEPEITDNIERWLKDDWE